MALADMIRGLTGWRRLLLAFFAGAASVLAFAPAYVVPILAVTFPVLIWLLDGAGEGRRGFRNAFLVGWAFGFGFFLAGLYWVGHAFLVDAQTFGWMLPFVAVLFPGGLALFIALALACARLMWAPGWPRIAVFSAAWAIAEAARGHLLTGFPWNLLAYVWAPTLPVLQAVSVVGSYGLSLLTVLAAASFAVLADGLGRASRLLPLGAALLFAVLAAWGAARLAHHPVRLDAGVGVRVVHAAIEQRDIEDPTQRRAIFMRYLSLSQRPGLAGRRVVIWPEAAVPFVLSREDAALAAIGDMLPPSTVLLTGALRLQGAPDGPAFRVFNTLHAVDSAGRIIATYDKTHLVPFGEYLPLAGVLERIGLKQLTGAVGGFAPGAGLRTLSVPGAPAFGPLICYEAIFPGDVTEANVRPRWLVNVTDDSWFGAGAGPRQHFDSARMRAIEEGLPLVRAANKGVSAIVDPLGRVLAKAAPGDAGVLDGDLPQPLARPLFSRLKDAPAAFLTLCVLLLGCMYSRRERRGRL